MKNIVCIAIDDEPIALSIIARFCERHGGLVLSTYSEPQAGLEAIQNTKPEIVFLDIEMNDINGLQIARKLPKDTCLVFTTAYTEYALDGFNLDAVDYLHKPFSYDRFEKSVARAMRRLESMRSTEQARTIVVKQEYDSILIPVSDILYIEAMENYIKIHRVSGIRTTSRMSLKSIIELLPEADFLRIHRSYVVAKNKITGFSSRHIQMQQDTELPVGRLYMDNVKELLASLLPR